ncbi:MAG: ATP-dependent helicase HrpB [Bacteroidia bacterium]
MSPQLPIYQAIPELKEKLAGHPVVILQAPPGAGKSTVLPLELLNEAWLKGKKILMLEPRRLAARSVANRMASLRNESIGNTIGYRIRFETKVSAKTRIEVVTEGILTRMLQQDNSLEEVGFLIFDEFHERSLQADLALALAYQAQQVLRNDLKILIMSATLDGEKLSSLLDNAPIVTSEGKQFPVTVHYTNIDPDAFLHLRMAKCIHRALHEHKGDILAFLPGTGEILRTQELLERENLNVYPLYGDLPQQKQQEAILPHPDGKRKIILATSIAETSLTIEGIGIVIDSGFARVPRFDPGTGLTKLETARVTKDAADQRAGRAGRLGPGVCLRMWSEGTQSQLNPNRNPEILEADLAPLMLELHQWGTRDVSELVWVTPPPMGAVKQAQELLQQLGAIRENKITPLGKEIARLPTHPRIAHMLIEAQKWDLENKSKGLSALATDIASIIEERDPLQREAGTDLFLRIEALRKWRKKDFTHADRRVLERIERLASSWRKVLKIEEDNSIPEETDAGKLLAAAYPERIAKQTEKHGTRYRLANGRFVKLTSQDDLVRQEWLAVATLDAGAQEGKIFLAAPLDPDDLVHLAQEVEVSKWDKDKGIIIAAREKRIGGITISSTPAAKISNEQRVKILCEAIREEGLKMIGWDEGQDKWLARIMSLKIWRKEEDWPNLTKEKLLDTLEEWLSPYLSAVSKRSELQQLNLTEILNTLLPWELSSKLEKLAPSKLEVPSGSMIGIDYAPDGSSPVMAVRLQEVFGMLETPTVNEGRVKILLHLLSPGYRPVQVTQDLKSFWEKNYFEVKKELRSRYPKHSWPEDPLTAEAIRGPKKRKQ